MPPIPAPNIGISDKINMIAIVGKAMFAGTAGKTWLKINTVKPAKAPSKPETINCPLTYPEITAFIRRKMIRWCCIRLSLLYNPQKYRDQRGPSTSIRNVRTSASEASVISDIVAPTPLRKFCPKFASHDVAFPCIETTIWSICDSRW